MNNPEVADLVDQMYNAFAAISDQPPEPGGGATAEEIRAAEADLGLELPEQLRQLYRRTRSGTVALAELIPIDGLAEHSMMMVEEVRNYPWQDVRPGEWIGSPPAGLSSSPMTKKPRSASRSTDRPPVGYLISAGSP